MFITTSAYEGLEVPQKVKRKVNTEVPLVALKQGLKLNSSLQQSKQITLYSVDTLLRKNQ